MGLGGTSVGGALAVALGASVYASAPPLVISVLFAFLCGLLTWRLIPATRDLFIQAGLWGKDLSKDEPKPQVAESLGVICGASYLVCMFFFIPVAFREYWLDSSLPFPHNKFVEFISALLSICCMIFLGFADDVLNLRWRHKLVLPTIATLPLLMVYMINFGSTSVVVPIPLRGIFGSVVNLGVLYYVYMGMLAVFCTNAINILAGINGVEAGQSLVIGLSIVINNLLQLNGPCAESHTFSLYLMLPFVATTFALLRYNWYPSTVFVGDTYCYFAGMTFAVVGILGHFSKTMLLFFIPQVLNFLYSLPQLFWIIPCPRHRLPKYDPNTKLLNMSKAEFKRSELSFLGRLVVWFLATFRLAHVVDREDGVTEMNNLTIINFVLKLVGPTREPRLTVYILLIQCACSLLAFCVRYQLAKFVYDQLE